MKHKPEFEKSLANHITDKNSIKNKELSKERSKKLNSPFGMMLKDMKKHFTGPYRWQQISTWKDIQYH